MLVRIKPALVAVAVAAAALSACDRERPSVQAQTAATPAPSLMSRLYFEAAANGDLFEVRSSELALQRTRNAQVFELLFAMGAQIDAATLRGLRASAFVDLGARGAAGLLQWMRAGDLPLGPGESVKARLRTYDRPTLQLMGIADGWANAELCAPLREVSQAPVRMRVFSKFDFASEDYAHLSLLHGRSAPAEVWRPALAFLNEATP